MVTCATSGEEVTGAGFLKSAAIGAISGAVGGSGANAKNQSAIIDVSNSVIHSTHSLKKRTMYLLKRRKVVRRLIKSALSTMGVAGAANVTGAFLP